MNRFTVPNLQLTCEVSEKSTTNSWKYESLNLQRNVWQGHTSVFGIHSL